MDLVIGQKVNKLTVLEFLGKIQKGKYKRECIKVSCECGVQKVIRKDYLPRVLSCGCANAEYNKSQKARDHLKRISQKGADAIKLPKGEAAFNTIFFRYQWQAKERGYDFDLSKEEFRFFTSGDCTYCGTPPANFSGLDSRGFNGGYIYNGIDRLDNSLGYTFNNCTASCHTCNSMKSAMDIEDFLEHIVKILNNALSKTGTN